CGVIHYRGAVSLRSRELLSKLKIPPLATDCFLSPSANPTVPDLLVSLDGGGGRSRTARREGSCDRLWEVIVCPLLAVLEGSNRFLLEQKNIKSDYNA
ncbi:MAG: hypothetical protein II297_07900, partial [Clostridia bacterium]|nr:hypothetical protein [Clostridia bacterium]